MNKFLVILLITFSTISNAAIISLECNKTHGLNWDRVLINFDTDTRTAEIVTNLDVLIPAYNQYVMIPNANFLKLVNLDESNSGYVYEIDKRNLTYESYSLFRGKEILARNNGGQCYIK